MSLLYFNDPQLWRKRAVAARALAKTITAPDARAKMQDVAVSYDAMADRASLRLEASKRPARPAAPAYPATRVLIVEDDALISLLLVQLLEELGCQVCASADNEAEAIELALRHRPDLMIVDLQLRSGNGAGAVEEIGRTASIPHVFISGAPADLQACRPDAVVIGKPFRQAALTKAIGQALAIAPTL